MAAQQPLSNPQAIITPNQFEGSDVVRINRAIEVAASAGRRVVIPRENIKGTEHSEIWLLDSAILLRSNTTLELDNCRIKLSDRCRDNLMRSANCGVGISEIQPMRNIHIRGIGKVTLEGADHPRATGDSAKTLGTQTYGTDAGVAGESQKGDWRNIGILMAFVEDFSIQNFAIKNSHCWAISLERCAKGTLSDLDFASTQITMIDGVRKTILNQDGIDLRQGCHDIQIENITGYTGDDLVALTAIPGTRITAGVLESTMVSAPAKRAQGLDDIHHVTLKNIKGFCRGGHHIVRFLNTSGLKLHDILLDGLTDTSPADVHDRAVLKIGDNNPRWGGVTPLGDTFGITVRNVTSRSQHAILIAGSLADSTISNVEHHGAATEPVTMESGPQYVRNVKITNAPLLQWQVAPETGRLTVRRAAESVEWQGDCPAAVGFWDDSGKEQSQAITPGEGWKLILQPIRGGCHLVCWQPALGFSITMNFKAAGDILTVGVRVADIKETGKARLKSLRLLRRFGAAREGDAGHLVVAQQSGALCNFREKKPAEHWVSVYQSSCQCPMPLFGMVRGGSAMAGIITSGQYDARFCVSVNWGPQQQYAIDPSFALRSFPEETRLPDDLTVQYHFLPAPEANWMGVGRRYRQYNFAQRGLKPLRARAAASPGLAYSAGAMEVRIRLGVKPVPYEIKEQTLETEPPVRVFCDFAHVRDILNEFNRQGIARAEVCLVGWNRGGHDGRYPQIYPVEPVLGGEAELRTTIRHGQKLGYQMVAHDCYYDAYRISEDWNEAYLRKDRDGRPLKGGAWGGGQSYNMCLAQAYELFARRDLPRTRELGFQGLHYSDVVSIIGPRPCYDPKHPQTRRQDAEAVTHILGLAQKTFGGSQSEGSLDFTASAMDRVLYVDCDKWLPLLKRPYVDTCIPLYEAVYHGVLLYNLSTEVVNSQPGEDSYLRTVEYGALPLAYFYGHFVLETNKNWLGQRDYRYDSAAGLKQTVADLRRVYDDVERLKHLQMEFLEGHRQVADNIFETTYGNGQRVLVNYRQTPYSLPGGGLVPARGWLLQGP